MAITATIGSVDMRNSLFLIRGLPGSGKTTLAQELVYFPDSKMKHFETDMFFEDVNGKYTYDRANIEVAHDWCKNQAQFYLERGWDVVVSNTFVCLWEMQPYFDMAEKLGIKVHVLECKGEYESVHKVPQQTIDRMKEKWEEYIQE
jgi:predicted kinase